MSHLLPHTQRLTESNPSRAAIHLQLFLSKKTAAGRSPATVRGYQHSIERFINYPSTPSDPAQWTDAHVDLWLASLRTGARPAAPASISHHRKVISVFIGWLSTRGECPDFRSRLEPITVPETPKRTLTREQVAALLIAAATGSQHRERNAAIIALFWSSGMRRSELAGLDFADVDWAEKLVRIPGHVAKTRNARRAILSDFAHTAMIEWRLQRGDAPGPLWLTAEGERLSSQAIRQMIARLAQRAGFRASSHDFRRGFISHMLEAGLDPVHAAKLGGWDSLEMVTHYGRAVAEKAAINAARKLA